MRTQTRNREIKRLALLMLDSVIELHKTGFLHRDIRPENFRVHDGQLFIINFANSREYMREGHHISKESGIPSNDSTTF